MRLFAVLIVAMAFLAAAATSDPKTPPKANDPSLEKMREVIAILEKELKTELHLRAMGANSEASVDNARVNLAKVRHDLAIQEKDFEGIVEQRRLILEVRTRELQRLQRMRGRDPSFEVSMIVAKRRLACASYLVAQIEGNHTVAMEQLGLVVDFCAKEEKIMEKMLAQGATSAWVLSRVRSRSICAQYLLAKAEGDPDKLIQQLRHAVTTCEREWKQMRQLHRNDAATFLNEYGTRVNLINAKIRLANLEFEREVVIEQLRNLIELHKELLHGVDGKDEASRNLKSAIKWDLARDGQRLALFSEGGPIDDLAVSELDP